jgi:hypothetical protein
MNTETGEEYEGTSLVYGRILCFTLNGKGRSKISIQF